MNGVLDGILNGPVPEDPQERTNRRAELSRPGGDVWARVWRLWLYAEQCRRRGYSADAVEALNVAIGIASAEDWNRGSMPVWSVESEGLQAKLQQDAGEPALAQEPLTSALQGLLYLAAAFQGEAPALQRAALTGAAAMVRCLMGSEALAEAARSAAGNEFETAVSLWTVERLAPQAAEMAARAVALIQITHSYDEANQVVNTLLPRFWQWQLPGWDPVLVEIGLQQALSSAATAAGLPDRAIERDDAAIALAARLAPGVSRDRKEAEAHINRANTLFRLARSSDAAADYERGRELFAAVGATVEALRARFGWLRARADAGQAVEIEAVRALLEEYESMADRLGRSSGALMEDLESVRRWYLSLLAETGAGDVDEVIALFEGLRGDRPLMRDGATHADRVVSHLSRPFTLLGARLAALRDTVVLVLEPGLRGMRRSPPVFLVISSPHDADAVKWRLVAASEQTAEALSMLSRAALQEQTKLLTGELSIRDDPSDTLKASAARAWDVLPDEVRAAIRAATTVWYLPSAAGRLDTVPLELLAHEGRWLGTTHVVVRCPSFQYLESVLAPNSRVWSDEARATVVHAAPDSDLGLLPEAEADVRSAMRAATLLGLQADSRQVSDTAEAVSLFTDRALVHYVGHGFAGEVGEFLQLSSTVSVSASVISDAAATCIPFVFFNTCLLGRVRHVVGGRQKGWAIALLDRGAPGVIGALYPLPDRAAPLMPPAFYRGAWDVPVGEGMRRARGALHADGVHPVVWAAYVLYGDPYATISSAVKDAPRHTRDMTSRWPSRLTKFLATGLPQHHAALIRAVEDDRALAGMPDLRDTVLPWALAGAAAPSASQRTALLRAIDDLLETDPEGAGVCRILLAVANMQNGDEGASLETQEFDAGYLAASALEDRYGMLFLLGRAGRSDTAVS